MTTDVRDILDRAAGDVPEGPDTDAILGRGRKLRRRRQALAATAALLLPVAVFAVVSLPAPLQLTGPSTEGSILTVPPPGEVTAVHLDDGTPVFVVHGREGDVHVVEALDAHDPLGVAIMVAWCPTSRMFEELSFGSRFWPDGTYAGGPSPSGLATFALAPVSDGTIRVTERLDPPTRTAPPSRQSAPVGPSCVDLEPAEALGSVLAHHGDAPAMRPEEAVGMDEGRRVLIEGTVEVLAGEPMRLCSVRDVSGPSCGADSPVVLDPPGDSAPDDPDFVYGIRGRLLATVADGGFRDVVATGLAYWHSEAFRGQMRMFGTLAPFPPPAGSGWSGIAGPPDAEPDLLLYTLEWLTGEEANAAARAAGEIGPHETVPNDYWIRDPGEGFFALHLADDVEVLGSIVLTGAVEPAAVTVEDLLAFVAADPRAEHTVFWATIRKTDGLVIRLEEQYRP